MLSDLLTRISGWVEGPTPPVLVSKLVVGMVGVVPAVEDVFWPLGELLFKL